MRKPSMPVRSVPVCRCAILFVVAVLVLIPVGVAQATGGDLVWARSMGGSNWDTGFDLAIDGTGNTYTTGFFQGTADFDPGPGAFNLTSAGNGDIFVSKLDSDGNFVWARAIGGTNDDIGLGVAVDGASNVYTIGRFQGTADFDPGPNIFNLTSAGAFDTFVSKLDSDGNFVWARAIGGTNQDRGFDIVVDEADNVYITGIFQGMVDFDPGPGIFNLASNSGSSDIFVSKLNSTGNFIWTRAMGGNNDDAGLRIAVDAVGNVYTTGIFRNTADFDPGPGAFNLTSAGDGDIFVSKLDSDGNFGWAWSVGSTGFDEGLGIVVDGTGNVYITALLRDAVTSANGADIFVGKLNSTGNLVWARAMGSTGFDKGYGIALDESEDPYITGTFQGTVDFDPGPEAFNLTSAGDGDIFVSKLDSGGDFVWSRSMGGTMFEEGIGIAVDETDNVYIAGRFQGTGDFDPGLGNFNLTSAGFDDIFVSKQAPPSPDNDSPGVIITETSGSTDITEGGATDIYEVVLANQPTTTVTINVNTDGQSVAEPFMLTFNNGDWNITQTVTITAVDDAIVEGAHSSMVSHSVSSDSNYDGIAVADVMANITDNDTASAQITETGGSTDITEGGTTDTYKVVLTSEPTATVTINVNSDTQSVVGPTVLTFDNANWNITQTMTVTAVDDALVEESHTSTISHTVNSADGNYDGIAMTSITANITDNDSISVPPESGDIFLPIIMKSES